MSLINDALRRAREAEQQRGETAPPASPLQPADHLAPPNRAGWIVLITLLVATLAFSAFYLSRWAGSSGTREPAATSNEVMASIPEPPREFATPPAQPDAERASDAAPRQGSAPRGERSFPPAPESAAAPPPAAPAPPAAIAGPSPAGATVSPGEAALASIDAAAQAAERFPELKLQSIVFRLRNPSVVINGEMLGVGGTVQGARVVQIERHAVTLEWRGQTNVLRLPQF